MRKFILSIVAVYAMMFVVGMCISLLSSQLLCSKINASVSAIQGSIWAVYPSIVYAISTYFPFIRTPFSNTLQKFGIPESYSHTIGIGYITMCMVWVSTVWLIQNTEKGSCNPDVAEMTEFKKKLLAELQQKQEAQEKNETTK